MQGRHIRGLVTAVTAPHSAVTSSKPNYSHVSEIHTYEDPYVSSLSWEGPRRTARLAFGFVEEETESPRGRVTLLRPRTKRCV